MTKNQLRTQLQQRRNTLATTQQADYSQQICQRVFQADCFKKAQHIAFYTPINGEANPLYLQKTPDKSYYLPVLSPHKKYHLIFVKTNPKTRYRKNIYAIPEPIYNAEDTIPAETLDLVIMPLVATDQTGNRMGMGGGYYDRSFAFKQTSSVDTPQLVGFAYDFQLVDKLIAKPWDIPLDFIATNKLFIEVKK
jgi:5-formyltetrahydrofolate cyclo-ligase